MVTHLLYSQCSGPYSGKADYLARIFLKMSCQIKSIICRALWVRKELYTFKTSCANSISHLTSWAFSKILPALEQSGDREVSHVRYLSLDAERRCHHKAMLTISKPPASPISSCFRMNGDGLYFV